MKENKAFDKIEDLINTINSTWLQEYCGDKCITECCDMNKGALHLREEEFQLLFRDEISELDEGDGVSKESLEKFVLQKKREGIIEDFENAVGIKYLLTNTYCPQYNRETKMCNVYLEEDRPHICREHPVYLKKFGIHMEAKCHYVYDNWEKIAKEFLVNNADLMSELDLDVYVVTKVGPEIRPILVELDKLDECRVKIQKSELYQNTFIFVN